MRKIWKRTGKGFLSVAICSAILLTGCGGSAVLSEPAGDMSTETAEKTSADQSNSADSGAFTAGQDVKESARPDYVMVVQLTINPRMNLYLDADGSVVDVEYLNEDAQNAFSELAVAGASLEDAVSMIVDVSADKGYLTEGKTISVDFMEPSSGETLQESFSGEILQELEEEVQAAVWETLAARQFTVILEINGENVESAANMKGTGNAGAPANPQDTDTPETSQTAGEACPACGGTGICPECGGGTLPCKRCGGSLWESCGVCGGGGRQSCPGCHGSGTDSTSGSSCRHCGGAGSITCEVCGGSGGKPCSICNGKGVVSDDCILCHGGKACTACGGTGIKQ